MASFSDLINSSSTNSNSNNYIATLSADMQGEQFVYDAFRYYRYDEYEDESLSYVNHDKTVEVSEEQYNLSQENNAEYVQFVVPRFFDGVDLALNMLFYFHYVRSDNAEGMVSPVNFRYSQNYIKFGVVMPAEVVSVAGIVKFELQAIGTTADGLSYKWISRTGTFNVIESLSGSGVVEPSSDWLESFLLQIHDQVTNAQTAVQQANVSVSQANSAAQAAQAAADSAEAIISDAKSELEQTVSDKVTSEMSSYMSDYYTKTEIDEKYVVMSTADAMEYLGITVEEEPNEETE